MALDVTELLTAAERAAAEQWMGKHREGCPRAEFLTTSVVAGYGFRVKVFCEVCGVREDVSDKGRDPYPHR